MQSLYFSRGKRRFVAVPNVNMRFSIIFSYIIVHLTIVLTRTSALLPWFYNMESSVCRKEVTEIETMLIPYKEIFLDISGLTPHQGSRVNYRLTFKNVSKIVDICCDGYEMIKDRCVPTCFPMCTNGSCKDKNLCECYQGYEEISTNVCRPICSKDCINGDCVKPDLCECLPNYLLNSDGYTCRPACDENCESNHGYCLVPNTCVCNYGYQKSNGSNICEPICDSECANGTCIAPNTCKCDEGFVVQRNETICERFCENACINGTCIAPNACQCNEDFVEMKSNNASVCVPACSRNCSGHGTCLNELNTCLCYYGWTGWDCDEASVCVYKTRLDSPLLSSVTVINETNSTLMESYDNAPLCYQCSDSLNNETLCLAVQSDESLTIPTVGCFLSTELPCYRKPRYNALKRSNHVTVYLIGGTIAIIAIAVLAAYAIVHKRQREKAASANQTILLNAEERDTLIVT